MHMGLLAVRQVWNTHNQGVPILRVQQDQQDRCAYVSFVVQGIIGRRAWTTSVYAGSVLEQRTADD